MWDASLSTVSDSSSRRYRADVERHLFTIFGGTGDLAKRKLLPALWAVTNDHERNWAILGVGTAPLSDAEYRDVAEKALVEAGADGSTAAAWCQRLYYASTASGFAGVAVRVAELDDEHQLGGNRVFYLALPPAAVPETVTSLGQAGLASSQGWVRLVIEKPYGRDLDTARGLNKLVHTYFREPQIYRIDHYLGKTTVQNLLVFRFGNPLFESAWNRDRIDWVQITVGEELGVGTRAGFYEQAGALRDIVQNHLTQVLCLVAMEPPVRMEAEAIRDEKVKVLRAIYPLMPEQVVLGQYTPGEIDGMDVPGYREEPKVAHDSTTATYAALRFGIDNWRWQGVPFYLRTGKRLARRLTQISIGFSAPPVCLFEVDGTCQLHGNVLNITLQPNEGFELLFDVRVPGEKIDLQTLPLDFYYAERFGRIPDAYETLLGDIVEGDQTLFVRSDEVEEAWRIYEQVLADPAPPIEYPAGSWGPAEAELLLHRRGHRWVVR